MDADTDPVGVGLRPRRPARGPMSIRRRHGITPILSARCEGRVAHEPNSPLLPGSMAPHSHRRACLSARRYLEDWFVDGRFIGGLCRFIPWPYSGEEQEHPDPERAGAMARRCEGALALSGSRRNVSDPCLHLRPTPPDGNEQGDQSRHAATVGARRGTHSIHVETLSFIAFRPPGSAASPGSGRKDSDPGKALAERRVSFPVGAPPTAFAAYIDHRRLRAAAARVCRFAEGEEIWRMRRCAAAVDLAVRLQRRSCARPAAPSWSRATRVVARGSCVA